MTINEIIKLQRPERITARSPGRGAHKDRSKLQAEEALGLDRRRGDANPPHLAFTEGRWGSNKRFPRKEQMEGN